MVPTRLPVHLGPGVDATRVSGVLAGLDLDPIEGVGDPVPGAPALCLVVADGIESIDHLNRLLQSAAVVVLHQADREPPEGWDDEAIWVPLDIHARVYELAATYRPDHEPLLGDHR